MQPELASEYCWTVHIFVRSDGERLPLVQETCLVPAHYATSLILRKRERSVAFETLNALAHDLVHLGQWAILENVDIHERFASGRYLNADETSSLAAALGVTTSALRRNQKLPLGRVKLSSADTVSNATKRRRLAAASDYLDLVARTHEAHTSNSEQAKRSERRQDMLSALRARLPRVRSSRVRNAFTETQLGRLIKFLNTGDPAQIWKDEDLRSRNWAIMNVLIATGVRQGELRQLKITDVDFREPSLTVERRPDGPEDPRVREPNAKTNDRIIPMSERLALILEDYYFGCGSDAAAVSKSRFLFLSLSNRSRGQPISAQTVRAVVADVGAHIGLSNLVPHALRHAWIQNLTNWAIENNIPDGQLDRMANYLGGWSDLSKSASEYRGDQLTRQAYEAGLKVEMLRQ